MNGIKSVSRCVYLACVSNCPNSISLKDYSLSIELTLLLHQDQLTISACVYFWAVYSVPLMFLSFSSLPDKNNALIIVALLRSGNVSLLTLYICCVVWLFWVFTPWYKLYNQFVNIHKITYSDFDWDCIEGIDQVVKNWHLNNIEYSFPWTSNMYFFIKSLISFIKVF